MPTPPSTPMTDDIAAILARVAETPDSAIDLAEAALALASLDRPGVALGWYRQHLGVLADAVRTASADAVSVSGAGGPGLTVSDAAGALRAVLAARYGYQGDAQTYDDLQNANFMRVIDRRKGLPVALGIVYLMVGRAQGWTMDGLSFPGHFLIRVEIAGERAILDPFNAGIERRPADLRDMLKAMAGIDAELKPEHYAPVSNRDVLLRLLDNLKLRLLRQDEPERALTVLGRMTAIAPDRGPLWHEVGLLRARLGNLAAAISALERYLDLAPGDPLTSRTALLVQQLKNRLN